MILEWIAIENAQQAQRASEAARKKAESVNDRFWEMEERLNRSLLALEALGTLLQDKLNVTDEELKKRITEIDLRDGKLDGKSRKTAATCSKCSRANSPRFGKCIYCLSPMMADPYS